LRRPSLVAFAALASFVLFGLRPTLVSAALIGPTRNGRIGASHLSEDGAEGTRTLDPTRGDVALNVVRNGLEVADFKLVQYPAPVTNSGKVGKTHSVCSVGDHNLGVFTIAEIALKNTNAVPPTYFFSEAPNTAYVDL
jgi:hypothetical protein